MGTQAYEHTLIHNHTRFGAKESTMDNETRTSIEQAARVIYQVKSVATSDKDAVVSKATGEILSNGHRKGDLLYRTVQVNADPSQMSAEERATWDADVKAINHGKVVVKIDLDASDEAKAFAQSFCHQQAEKVAGDLKFSAIVIDSKPVAFDDGRQYASTFGLTRVKSATRTRLSDNAGVLALIAKARGI